MLKNYKEFINESVNRTWTYEGDFKVTSDMISNGKFIKNKIPDEITGYFYCRNNNLTSLEGGPSSVGGNFYSDNNNNDLTIERDFIKSGSYNNKGNYWFELLTYMIKNNININKVKGWPEGFLDSNVGKSVKSIGKFNL